MDDPARYASEKPVDMPEAKTDRYRQRLRELGIDPDADPIDILIQLTDYCQKLPQKPNPAMRYSIRLMNRCSSKTMPIPSA